MTIFYDNVTGWMCEGIILDIACLDFSKTLDIVIQRLTIAIGRSGQSMDMKR